MIDAAVFAVASTSVIVHAGAFEEDFGACEAKRLTGCHRRSPFSLRVLPCRLRQGRAPAKGRPP